MYYSLYKKNKENVIFVDFVLTIHFFFFVSARLLKTYLLILHSLTFLSQQIYTVIY